MKHSPLLALLMALLTVSSAAAALLSFQYIHSVRSVQQLQFQRVQVNRMIGQFQDLLKDTLEYAKTNPSIDPVLQSIGVKVNRPAAANPATKPATKP